jgi:hypothetical protein
MFRNQCLTGGTEHGCTDQIMQRGMRPKTELYRFPRRLGVPCTESSSPSAAWDSKGTAGAQGRWGDGRA